MKSTVAALACLAYLAGLLLIGLTKRLAPVHWGLTALVLWVMFTGIALIGIYPTWRRGPTKIQWLVLGLIGLIASGYAHLRYPQPGLNDLSQLGIRI